MPARPRFPRTDPSPTLLYRAIAVALALGGCGMVDAASVDASPRGGAVHVVHNCNDDGPGSLREAAQLLAASGDRIDLAQLPCSRITLATGAISFGLDDLELVGPGAAACSHTDSAPRPISVRSSTTPMRSSRAASSGDAW